MTVRTAAPFAIEFVTSRLTINGILIEAWKRASVGPLPMNTRLDDVSSKQVSLTVKIQILSFYQYGPLPQQPK